MKWPEDGSWADMTVAVYAALIESRTHFAQAAYRDGEWYCMLGHSGQNCNGERYDRRLGAMLRETLLEPVGQWCVFWWPHPTKGVRIRKEALAWIEKHKPAVHWIPDRPIAWAGVEGRAAPFWRACRTRRSLLVGPEHLTDQELFPVACHVVVPASEAWHRMDDTVAALRGVIQEGDIVLFAAGMASNVMIHRLWPFVRGRATLYDVGSALDPYCGVYSRGVYKDERWQKQLMPRNVP